METQIIDATVQVSRFAALDGPIMLAVVIAMFGGIVALMCQYFD